MAQCHECRSILHFAWIERGSATGEIQKGGILPRRLILQSGIVWIYRRSVNQGHWNSVRSPSIDSPLDPRAWIVVLDAQCRVSPHSTQPQVTAEVRRLKLHYLSLSEFQFAISHGFSYSYSALAVLVLVLEETASSTSTFSLSTSTTDAKQRNFKICDQADFCECWFIFGMKRLSTVPFSPNRHTLGFRLPSFWFRTVSAAFSMRGIFL